MRSVFVTFIILRVSCSAMISRCLFV